MAETKQATPFVLESEIEELESRAASAIANPGTGDVVTFIGLVYAVNLSSRNKTSRS